MSSARADAAPGRVRIIGGRLRGSRLAVADAPGLRPTPDRVRETLFNWLAPIVEGARCLDLYAGTGALGIEALSRGAASVDFVEADARRADELRANLARLKQAAAVHRGDALVFIAAHEGVYDLVFLDPPFDADAWAAAALALERHARLAAHAVVYVESPRTLAPELPANWTVHREGHAGAVRYALYRRSIKL
ncbi:MAG TPA: 16S rRNA (guanine(966)-N(2))-methyltransferase RsmD [Rudaea sp.]|nr:16S rRNA (guanine(966)-N(2))-methyltransferase RsmD [Rudaea sp.]